MPYAVSFDGVSSYAATAPLNMASARQMTILFDLLILERLGSSVAIELSTNYNLNNAFALFLEKQKITFGVHGNTGNVFSVAETSEGEIPVGRKVRVALTWNGTQVSGQTLIYINGQGRTSGWSTDQNVLDAMGNAALYFGARAGASAFSKYQISECIVIVGKCFNDAEILQEFKNAELPDLTGASKVVHLMADTGKAVWRDYSGNSYHATITNTYQTRARDSRRKRFPVKPTLADIIAIPGISVFHASYGITKDGSDKVSRWDEVSGNGFYLAQATGANQPTWLASAVNSLPAVRLSNSGNSFMTGTNAFEGGNLPNSLFCVAKPHTSIPAAFCGFMAIGTGGTGGATSSIGTNNLQKLWFGGAGDGTLDFFVPTVGETYYLGKVHNGRCVDVFINGRFISTQGALVNSAISPATSMALGLYSVGTTSPNVDIPFAVFAYRALDMAETQAIYRYAKSEFGTALARQTASGRQTADIYGVAGASATATVTVDDFSDLAGQMGTTSFEVTNYVLLAGLSLDLFGMGTLVESVDFTAATSNDATAGSIASAINTAVGETVATATGAVVDLVVPGSINGASIVWTAPGGVTPTTATVTGGIAETEITIAGTSTIFGTQPSYIDIGSDNDECADNIAAWVNGWGAGITAIAVANVVHLTVDEEGSAGNAYTLAQAARDDEGVASGGLSFSGSTFSGGVDGTEVRHRSLAT